MICELRIKNFAIIDSLDLEFSSGLNVITGETGSGKSVILEALGLLLGDRAASDMIRSGQNEAEVQGLLSIDFSPALANVGIEQEEEGVILRRLVSSAGKNRIYINNTLSNLRTLSGFGTEAIDIHGQFEHQSLLLEDRQMDLLDKSGDLLGLRKEVESFYRKLADAMKRLNIQEKLERDRAQREDLLRFQVDEIEEADLKPGEDSNLEDERIKLSNTEKLNHHAGHAYDLLYEAETACLSGLAGALADLEEILRYDESVKNAADALREAIPYVEDSARFMRDYRDSLEAEPERLDKVIERLELFKKLKRKYGSTIEEILAHLDKSKQDLDSIDNAEQNRDQLLSEIQSLEKTYVAAAEKLTKSRKATAYKIEKSIQDELAELDMPSARFKILLEPESDVDKGRDRVCFMISANPGEQPRPLARIASGGELSRVMLAIKSIMGNMTPILVFDEVDAGIGGSTANAVGRRLKKLSKEHQVICVTHLSQIASYGDHHIKIEKVATSGETAIRARKVEGDARIAELARMLSGTTTETSLKHAEEMVRERRS